LEEVLMIRRLLTATALVVAVTIGASALPAQTALAVDRTREFSRGEFKQIKKGMPLWRVQIKLDYKGYLIYKVGNLQGRRWGGLRQNHCGVEFKNKKVTTKYWNS
jgi:hypothetical protein